MSGRERNWKLNGGRVEKWKGGEEGKARKIEINRSKVNGIILSVGGTAITLSAGRSNI